MKDTTMGSRKKGLITRRKMFEHNHGEWIKSADVAIALSVHPSTTLREMKRLAGAGFYETRKTKTEKGRDQFEFRAIKPKNAKMTVDMFIESTFRLRTQDPLPDYSWMPTIVRQWGGYRVMGAAA